MIKSKGWDWERNKEDKWLIPCVESAYLAERWKGLGFFRFLDIGCGLGRHSVYMADKGFDVTGADISEFAAEHLKKWAKRLGLKVEAVVSDMFDLPFKDNEFDCVMAYNSVYHTDTEGFGRALEEVRRVLKPGGELFITLISKGTWSFLNASDSDRVDENTVIRNDKDTENNVPHFYMDYYDIKRFFKGFEFVLEPVEECEYNQNKPQNVSKHWRVLLKKIG